MLRPFLNNVSLPLGVRAQNTANDLATAARRRVDRHSNEDGEGVISAAIAVLIFALIGSLMWVAYAKLFNKSSDNAGKAVDKIGEQVAP